MREQINKVRTFAQQRQTLGAVRIKTCEFPEV